MAEHTTAVAKRPSMTLDGAGREGAAPRAALLNPACDSRLLSELRAPLLSIHAALRLALAGSAELLRPEDREMLEIAVRSTERLAHLLDGVLEVPALDAVPTPAPFGATIVSKLVDEAARAMRPMAISRSVALDAACEPDLPSLDASHAGLARVLATLLASAIEASPRGEKVTLRAARLGRFVEFIVTAAGRHALPAPAEDALAGSPSRLEPSPGRPDLGPAICRTIVEQHGGRIWAEPAAPRRWRVVFVIPLAQADLLARAVS